jgi:hypothetical protein
MTGRLNKKAPGQNKFKRDFDGSFDPILMLD